MNMIQLSQIPESYISDLQKAASILKEAGCTEVYVFGSLADGTASDDSDIDIAVKGLPKESYFKLGGRLMMELSHRFDLIDLDDNESRFALHIQKKGGLVRVA